jgi:hypothetical protein
MLHWIKPRKPRKRRDIRAADEEEASLKNKDSLPETKESKDPKAKDNKQKKEHPKDKDKDPLKKKKDPKKKKKEPKETIVARRADSVKGFSNKPQTTVKQQTDTPTLRDAPTLAFATVEVEEISRPPELQGISRNSREPRETTTAIDAPTLAFTPAGEIMSPPPELQGKSRNEGERPPFGSYGAG